MQGTVLDFSVRTNGGIISGDDGARYLFSGAEWLGQGLPLPEMRVDFENAGGGASAVYQIGLANPANRRNGGLYRSLDEGIVAGVCAGLAAKWKISRLGLRIVALFIPYIWPFYVLAWLTFPAIETGPKQPLGLGHGARTVVR